MSATEWRTENGHLNRNQQTTIITRIADVKNKFHQDRKRKKCGRTDIESGFIRSTLSGENPYKTVLYAGFYKVNSLRRRLIKAFYASFIRSSPSGNDLIKSGKRASYGNGNCGHCYNLTDRK